MEKLKGIVLYNIERDGCLNGVYTNNLTSGAEIFTETAKLKSKTDKKTNENTFVEVYDCFYFDAVDGRIDCTLTFTSTNGIIDAKWVLLDDDRPLFIGQGFLMNDRQIAISYWGNPRS